MHFCNKDRGPGRAPADTSAQAMAPRTSSMHAESPIMSRSRRRNRRILILWTMGTLAAMPKSPNRDGSRMEDAIIKIIDLENEINQDMMKLVELKKDIIRRIIMTSK